MLTIKTDINVDEHAIGVTVARFQVKNLHQGQRDLIDTICRNHSKVIIFLGITNIGADNADPLDYATREAMVKSLYPSAIVLPQRDNRSDYFWSKNLDNAIKMPFGDVPALLYGSRDSFLPHYKGQYKTIELISAFDFSGTQSRKQAANEILPTADFRAGVIHAVYAQRPVTFPTVDVVAYNEKNEILLGKKPNENLYRFIGGFVDRTDENWEQAAKREFREETGDCEIDDLKYIASIAVKDWRYAKSKSGIMTTLFLGKFIYGSPKATDDIEGLKWVNPFETDVENDIMPEHQELFKLLLNYLSKNKK